MRNKSRSFLYVLLFCLIVAFTKEVILVSDEFILFVSLVILFSAMFSLLGAFVGSLLADKSSGIKSLFVTELSNRLNSLEKLVEVCQEQLLWERNFYQFFFILTSEAAVSLRKISGEALTALPFYVSFSLKVLLAEYLALLKQIQLSKINSLFHSAAASIESSVVEEYDQQVTANA